ncbi:GNAT family N-acetyltransferase [Streptomyces althioticus]|uniref:GNAT family N-acetyltransferase n=1 Tax=Streptomyces althioticus TaxID=83380 RepID=UPI0036A8E533
MSRPPRITRIGPEELEAAVVLHQRCTPHTLWSRYHRSMPNNPHAYLPALLGSPGSVHLAAWANPGQAVALAHLLPDGAAAEAALLVEDTWQSRGLGTRLLRALTRYALDSGCKALYGLALPGDERIAAILRHAVLPIHSQDEGGSVRIWVHTKDLEAVADQRHPWHTKRARADRRRPA